MTEATCATIEQGELGAEEAPPFDETAVEEWPQDVPESGRDGACEMRDDVRAEDAVHLVAAARAQSFQYLSCTFPQTPELLYQSSREYADAAIRHCPNGNFLKGVKWSPDGACLLTASDDNGLRLFDLPSDATTSNPAMDAAAMDMEHSTDTMQVGLCVAEGETIYDYAWYSRMTTSDAVSCCFASTSRCNPIHLWDACSGSIRCTYRGYDDADEVTAAYSVAFSPDGTKLFAGYKKSLRIFDVNRPGRDSKRVYTHVKREASLPGIISCIGFNPCHPQFACGSYAGLVALFDTQRYGMQLLLHGHQGGVTHVLFSNDGNFLYSGARQDPHIVCWDLRYAKDAVFHLPRCTAATNQRVYFDIESGGRYLATGGTDGAIKVFDLQTADEVQHLPLSSCTVNGCAFHPNSPFLAASTGHRHYPLQLQDGADNSDGEDAESRQQPAGAKGPDNRLCVWRLEHQWLTWEPASAEEVVAMGTVGAALAEGVGAEGVNVGSTAVDVDDAERIKGADASLDTIH